MDDWSYIEKMKRKIYLKSARILRIILLPLNWLRDCIHLILYTLFVAYPLVILQSILPFRWKSLKEEVILVTGTCNEIGRELCLRFGKLEKCCSIICWDSDKANTLLVDQLRTLGVKKVAAFKVDLGDREQVRAAAAKVRQDVGEVTILINNAKLSCEPVSLWKTSPEDVEKILNVNLKSYVWTLQEFLPVMIRKDKGHVVTISSDLSWSHSKRTAAYATAEHAVRGCVESVKEDLRNLPNGSRVQFTSVFHHAAAPSPLTERLTFKHRYSFANPHPDAAQIAEQVIYGMRTCQETIYIPFQCRLGLWIYNITLSSVHRKWMDIIEYEVASPADDDGYRYP